MTRTAPSPGWPARTAISERYAYPILSRLGTSLGDWLRTRRLARAAADLAGGLSTHDTIADVAHRWGFPDHANFTRASRRAHGTTPRVFRRDATR